VLLIIAGAIIGLYLADRVVFTPLAKGWKARSERITQLRKQVGDAEQLIKREASIRERWKKMQAGVLPANNSVAEEQVLKAFDAWSQSSRVSILGITPQWRKDSDDYRTLECRVEASGDLATLSRFLHEIERDPLGVRLQSVELSARDTRGQQLSLGLQLSGVVFTFQEEKRP
jgi:acetolactate synthase small subunit